VEDASQESRALRHTSRQTDGTIEQGTVDDDLLTVRHDRLVVTIDDQGRHMQSNSPMGGIAY
jgi:hypothetical protein